MKALVAAVLSVCLGGAALPARSDAAQRTLFNGTIHIDYGQAYINSSTNFPDFEHSFFDCQRNGLAGAAIPGFIYLVNGIGSGYAKFRVELADREPPVDQLWEDIVEVSFEPSTKKSSLLEWAGERSYPLNLPARSYRVRYSSNGMDEARQAEGQSDEPIESHLLTFWPAPTATDRIVKSTSRQAAYWHEAWWKETGARRPGPDCP